MCLRKSTQLITQAFLVCAKIETVKSTFPTKSLYTAAKPFEIRLCLQKTDKLLKDTITSSRLFFFFLVNHPSWLRQLLDDIWRRTVTHWTSCQFIANISHVAASFYFRASQDRCHSLTLNKLNRAVVRIEHILEVVAS